MLKTDTGGVLESQLTGDDGLNGNLAPSNEAALKADGWPRHGGVQFKNVSMRYDASSPLVLKNMSLTVPPGGTLGTPRHL